MSTGGVFRLIANDGKADRLIMATKLLNQRIKDVMCARRRMGKSDFTPTLSDLEKTHILHMNAHFKPFAAIGYEYNKVRAQTGTTQLGNSVTFSIPQFGDFFHDMVGHQTLTACYSSLLTAPAANGTITVGAGGMTQSFPRNGYDWDNTTTLTNSMYDLVDPFGVPVALGGKYRNMVRYCEYPGERLYQHVKFDVNGNPLDEYYDTTINMLRKFTVGADKILGYKRLVGQEITLEGFSGPKHSRIEDLHQTNPATISHLTDSNDIAANAAPLHTPAAFLTRTFPENSISSTAAPNVTPVNGAAPIYFDVQRSSLQCLRGPQTPKYWQPPLEIWNKLKFWFNDDARLSIPSVSIPFGQRYITIELARQELLTYEFPGLFVRQVIDLPAAVAGTKSRTTRFRPWWVNGQISEVSISNIELYVNNIFVNPEVHDIFIKRVGFSLIRVYRRHVAHSNSDKGDDKLLSQLKWPIEYMFVGLRPTWNINHQNLNQHRDWHRFTKIVDIISDESEIAEISADAIKDEVNQGSLVRIAPGATSSIGQIYPDRYVMEMPTIDSLTLTAHGINIHDGFPEMFFNSYNPYHYGGPSIVTPDDRGALMINFTLFTKSYQPSGHLNVSRAREFYFTWLTSYVTASTSADLIAIAVAINFLLITDGSAVLRYST
jgi:hypothetical protein